MSQFGPLRHLQTHSTAAFVALTACTFNLHSTKAPRMLKYHKNVSLAEGKENKREI